MAVTKKDLKNVISKLEKGDYKCYFFLPDFEKHSGGIQWIYNHVKRLNQEGYNAIIVHQKNGFVPEWLKDWFDQDEEGNFIDINIQYLDNKNLQVNLEDFFFIPEGFPQLMENLRNAPCKKVVYCLNWYYVLNALQPGIYWDSYGIRDCLSISQSQTNYLRLIMPFLNFKQVTCQVGDPEVYFPPEKSSDKKMQIAFIKSRDGGQKAYNVIKTFYALFPYFRFIKFVELSGMDKDTFAQAMRESQFYAHFDEASSLGTAPIEAWRSGCLVAGWDGVGGVEFMNPQNTWLAPNGDIVRLALALGNMIEAFIMNSVPNETYMAMEEACERYTADAERNSILNFHEQYLKERIEEVNRIIELTPEVQLEVVEPKEGE